MRALKEMMMMTADGANATNCPRPGLAERLGCR